MKRNTNKSLTTELNDIKKEINGLKQQIKSYESTLQNLEIQQKNELLQSQKSHQQMCHPRSRSRYADNDYLGYSSYSGDILQEINEEITSLHTAINYLKMKLEKKETLYNELTYTYCNLKNQPGQE